MNQEEELLIEQARAQIAAANSGNYLQQSQANAQTQMMEEQEKTMAQEQLDLSEELDRIEHLLRGHILKRDTEGNGYWDEDTSQAPPPLNEYGVRLIMKLISFYLNKNKLLSNYDPDQVAVKMEDFSIELADMIFMKYKEMGFDNPEKRKIYPAIVREIQDSVHDVYNRALKGGERSSIRKHWNITENVGAVQDTGGKVNPLGWLRR